MQFWYIIITSSHYKQLWLTIIIIEQQIYIIFGKKNTNICVFRKSIDLAQENIYAEPSARYRYQYRYNRYVHAGESRVLSLNPLGGSGESCDEVLHCETGAASATSRTLAQVPVYRLMACPPVLLYLYMYRTGTGTCKCTCNLFHPFYPWHVCYFF